ncbi:conserved Plasmodium protein, unknown function [Plasmodium gallinaceum]|uniref:Uncharacterized protein n=1 Tax=Plasmodium gallinaceum TaxID=5849 RepID=A0A1J1GR30_PLAGA|nr:conserved Plasmodium protein, unknown function [Plasmodium gallinaceum]CRG93727.1 conserved Plasmodium protein, unknown function [Plasmodium gallinaceum]
MYEMKRFSETQIDTFNSAKIKKNLLDVTHDCQKSYIFCKTNNFNNLLGLQIEKNLFYFNFLLSIKYNEEKKKKKENLKYNETIDNMILNKYYLSQDEKVYLEKKEGENNENLDNFFEKNINVLIKYNFFFYIKIYIHNILSNVDICAYDKPNETFFEFFYIFKNKKKKVSFENCDDLLSDLYCDVSHVSDDSDYNYFYEKANQLNEFEEEEYEEGKENEKEIEKENEKVNEKKNELENENKNGKVESYNEIHENNIIKKNIKKKIDTLTNLNIKLNLTEFEKRNSNFSTDDDKKKKKKKDKKFEKYLCRCCKKKMKNMNCTFSLNNSNVCLLQIFISNLTKKELLFWAQIKECIENFIGNIKSIIFHKGMSNYIEIPYIEIIDELNKMNEDYLRFVRKKKKIITLKKEQKSIKCLFERTLNSVRISVKYKLISTNNKFNYLFKDVMQKYKKFMRKNIFNNNVIENNILNNEFTNSIHNYLNPIVFKNNSEKNYDFSILVHKGHLELYGYVYLRNYIFFLLIMIEVYIFINFNDINYTYSNNTDIFLDQILKNLFT